MISSYFTGCFFLVPFAGPPGRTLGSPAGSLSLPPLPAPPAGTRTSQLTASLLLWSSGGKPGLILPVFLSLSPHTQSFRKSANSPFHTNPGSRLIPSTSTSGVPPCISAHVDCSGSSPLVSSFLHCPLGVCCPHGSQTILFKCKCDHAA